MQEMVMAGEVVWNGYGKQSSTPRSSMVLSSYSSKSPLAVCTLSFYLCSLLTSQNLLEKLGDCPSTKYIIIFVVQDTSNVIILLAYASNEVINMYWSN
jgi:hypothetical protein